MPATRFCIEHAEPGRCGTCATWSSGSSARCGPAAPSPADEAWVAGPAAARRAALWRRMSGADRRHAVGVARGTEGALGAPLDRPVMAAALLHDVGKVDSGLGPFAGRSPPWPAWRGHEAASRWRARPGPAGRAGRYLCHDAIGADLLAAAGSDALTVAWAREHHLAPDRWTVPVDVGRGPQGGRRRLSAPGSRWHGCAEAAAAGRRCSVATMGRARPQSRSRRSSSAAVVPSASPPPRWPRPGGGWDTSRPDRVAASPSAAEQRPLGGVDQRVRRQDGGERRQDGPAHPRSTSATGRWLPARSPARAEADHGPVRLGAA